MAGKKQKKSNVDHLEVISDLAEVILLDLDAGPVLKKHKPVIDQAFSHVIMKNYDPRLDSQLEALAKRTRSKKPGKRRPGAHS